MYQAMRAYGGPLLIAMEKYIKSIGGLSLRKSPLSCYDSLIVVIMSAGTVDPKLIGSIPPASLKTLPAGQPPPGIQPNFVDPPTRVPVILGVGIAFLVLAVLCFSIRIYSKLATAKSWKWDDGEWHLMQTWTFEQIPD